jgi:uncharacterized protein YegL
MTQKTEDIRIDHMTDIVFILDRSGSMGGRESDTIGGYNSFLTKQKVEPGHARVSTILFDSEYEVIHDRLDIKEVLLITKNEYYVRGSTALLDAIGKSVYDLQDVHMMEGKTKDNSGAIFVIITDGMENASHHYSYAQIRELIHHKNTNDGWEFIYLGADLSKGEDADRMGFARDRQANYDKSKTVDAFESVSDSVKSYRSSKSISNHWRENFLVMDEMRVVYQKLPIVDLLEGRFLIASDQPISIGDVSSVTILNKTYPLTGSPLLQRYRSFSGLPIDGMIGQDILSQLKVMFNTKTDRIETKFYSLSSDIEMALNLKSKTIPLKMINSHLGMMAELHGKKAKFIFDTKSHMTTLRESMREEPIKMSNRDFHTDLGLIKVGIIDLRLKVKLDRGTTNLAETASVYPEDAFIGLSEFAGSLCIDSFRTTEISILNLSQLTYTLYE